MVMRRIKRRTNATVRWQASFARGSFHGLPADRAWRLRGRGAKTAGGDRVRADFKARGARGARRGACGALRVERANSGERGSARKDRRVVTGLCACDG